MNLLPLIAAFGLVVGAYCFAKSARHWDTGLHILIVVFFFGGIVGANLGSSAYPILFRDVFIVLPLYFGLFSRRAGQLALAQIPPDLLMIIMFLMVSVLLSAFNSVDEGILQIGIAAKVWLYYIPFLVVGLALAADQQRMLWFFRQFLLWGTAACTIGLAQSLLVRVVGYEQVIGWFFGKSASAVTQGFTYFEQVGGVYRIPGPFSYGAQYFDFLRFFITVAIIEANIDPNPRLQRLAQYAVFLAAVAGVLCGSREGIIFVPVALLFYGLYGLLGARLLLAAPLGAVASFGILWFSGLQLLQYFYWGQELVYDYTTDFIVEQAAQGLDYGMLGKGLGVSSTAARYAFNGITTGFAGGNIDAAVGLESYFGKAGSELGWIGFVVVVMLMTAIAARCATTILQNWRRRGRFIVAPIAFILAWDVVLSTKGKILDIDPANVLIWLFLGLLIGLNRSRRHVNVAPAHEAVSLPVPNV